MFEASVVCEASVGRPETVLCSIMFCVTQSAVLSDVAEEAEAEEAEEDEVSDYTSQFQSRLECTSCCII